MSLNPVMPSLIWGTMEAAFPEADARTLEGALCNWARRTVEADGLDTLVPATYACDAILVCKAGDTAESIEVAARSILHQEHVHVHLHVVADGESAFASVDALEQSPNVQTYRYESTAGRWQRIQELVPRLHTSFLALVKPGSESVPDRLFTAIGELERLGDEIALVTQEAVCPVPFDFDPAHPAMRSMHTLVVRRASLVDMGGFDVSRNDAAQEWLHRAVCERRSLVVLPEVSTVRSGSTSDRLGEDRLGASPLTAAEPAYSSSFESLRVHASGFEPLRPRCDVVLPFKDSFHLVRESLESLLTQKDADVVIHLVDDTSDESIDSLFGEYAHHDNIRLYQNERNLGPFGSFNNICEFAETPYIAVQDADDISLPDRIATSVNILRNAGADILGSRSELFGEPELVEQMRHQVFASSSGESVSIRNSRFPGRYHSGYFLENPTLVMRVGAFVELGGYGDFGEGKRNRTGVDTDFQSRAHFARAAIATTREILVRYRCHGSSAVNHQESGLGSKANLESHEEMRRRFKRYVQGSFDPRWFGALGRHRGVTRRVN